MIFKLRTPEEVEEQAKQHAEEQAKKVTRLVELRAEVEAAEATLANAWSWRALVMTDPDLARELRAQREDFAYACRGGDRREIEDHGGATLRGLQIATQALAGVPPDAAPPDLQELVVRFGTWDKIPREAWADYDSRLASWKTAKRYGEHGRLPPPRQMAD